MLKMYYRRALIFFISIFKLRFYTPYDRIIIIHTSILIYKNRNATQIVVAGT